MHNYWNHLIESAGHKAGSSLIWDTGTYEVLEWKGESRGRMTDDEDGDSDTDIGDLKRASKRTRTIDMKTTNSSLRFNRDIYVCASMGLAYQITTPSSYACAPSKSPNARLHAAAGISKSPTDPLN